MINLRNAISAAVVGEPCLGEAGRLYLKFSFSKDFPGFSGHFPGYPVLPAVVQIMAGMLVAEALRRESLRLVALEGAKFMRPIMPDTPILVECSHLDQAKGGHPVRLVCNGEVVSTFRLVVESR